MKVPLKSFLCLAVFISIAGHTSALETEVARFAASKEAQARELTAAQTSKVPQVVWSFFDAVRVDDWETATNLFERLRIASGRFTDSETNQLSPSLRAPLWQSISETLGVYEQIHDWDSRWLHRFAREIIESVPKGSVYFGGTDPGRFIISALSESQREGRPFFVLTQNQLADSTYLDYLRWMFDGGLYIPTTNDARGAFNEYLEDAQKRLKTGGLKPGENVQMVDGHMQVSGQVAVMEINGLLAKIILEKNTGREFYIEESFALDWMYPQLSPHGLIFRLHPKPLPGLGEKMIQEDQDFWRKLMSEMVGDWLTDKTSIKEICNFADKIYWRKDLDGFKGDPGFARNPDAQKCFSKLRSSIAGLYAWRSEHASERDEKNRYRNAADLAFRQAFVLCPYSPEAVFRYSQLLQKQGRQEEAILIAETALRADQEGSDYHSQLRDLARQLHSAK